MFLGSLTDREVETLILALKYWRCHRRGDTRRTDHVLTREEAEILIAKLELTGYGRVPPDGLKTNLFSR
jgi:hypothetical protein